MELATSQLYPYQMVPVRVIQLTQGQCTIVDPEDYEAANQYKWQAKYRYNLWHATRNIYHPVRKTQSLHTLLMRFTETDHINSDGLDNRRINLREANGKNATNQRSHLNVTSRFKGVCWIKKSKRWSADIYYQGKQRHLGYFTDEKAAARAYDEAAREHHGKYGRYNFPLPGEQPAVRLQTVGRA